VHYLLAVPVQPNAHAANRRKSISSKWLFSEAGQTSAVNGMRTRPQTSVEHP
jgi:hypothetical protein